MASTLLYRQHVDKKPNISVPAHAIRDCVIAIAFVLSLAATSVQAGQSVTLAWDANPEPGIAGYRLYYGEPPGNYSNSVDVGNVTSFSVANLVELRTYSFYVTAYNIAGLESDPSSTVSYTVPLSVAISGITSTPQGIAFSWASIPGRTYRVVYKQNLNDAQWTDASLDLLSSGASLYWIDANSASSAQRFYSVILLP